MFQAIARILPRHAVGAALLLYLALPLHAALAADKGEEIHITHAGGPIEIDGNLNDAGWKGATRWETFYETNPGDNVPPKVKTVAYLTYDDQYFYAGFEFSDPDVASLRAPLGDRDNVPSYTDYGGVILDTKHDGKSAILFLVNPRNVQYDAMTNDASGEDSSLDLYWDSATRIHAEGWTVEIRIPFSSLRYTSTDPQTWGILLYRNRPREFRTQIFNTKLPRGGNCFICHDVPLTGLTGLPKGGHVVVAPYGTVKRDDTADPGSPLHNGNVRVDGGIDAKWTPNAYNAIDAAINPDFSQVESDVAQIATNQRFALLYQEKRPFFLEGLDLFATPIQAVYTRTITSPRWGLRATGQLQDTSYTLLVAQDRGGGSVILPGAESSSFAPQDFSSLAVVGRARRDIGTSFVSFLLTDREVDGGGHNRVFGPDFLWRPTSEDAVTGQVLLADTLNPDRPDLSTDWTGQKSTSHALYLSWDHSTQAIDWSLRYKDLGDAFRADDGFLPQVGIRDGELDAGYSIYPKGLFNRIRSGVAVRYFVDTDGRLVSSTFAPTVRLDGFWTSQTELTYGFQRVRVADRIFSTPQLSYTLSFSPSRFLGGISLTGYYGDDVDVSNVRSGRGGVLNLAATLRPTEHLELKLNGSRQWLDVAPLADGPYGGAQDLRLFTSTVARLKATYTFTSRTFLRLIGQRVTTERDPSLFLFGVPPRDDGFSGSALVAYKLNWQTVVYVGFGDDRSLQPVPSGGLERIGREYFLKLSYAFQR